MGIIDDRITLPPVLDIALPAVRRPRHGEFDIAFVTALAQRAMLDPEAALELRAHVFAALVSLLTDERCNDALRDDVSDAAAALLSRLAPDSDADPEAARDLALELADAFCEALGVCEAATSDLLGASGLVEGQCREHLLGADGEVLRERFPQEGRPERCYLLCPEGHCARAAPPAPALERTVRDWRLCGGARRSCLPRAGGLEDQDAATLFWFQQLDDAQAAQAEAAETARREPWPS